MKTIVVAGTHSGVGKTSFTLGLMAALRARGMVVQGFKVGPDFIDPSHHARITSRPSHNLDGWMLSRQSNLAIFARAVQGADVAVVEGVMGLYDGAGPGAEGSTAQMARWLEAGVVLVCDAGGMGQSIAALAKGYATAQGAPRVVGVVANRVGSPTHRRILTEAMGALGSPPLLGCLPRIRELAIPERHLGLLTAHEHAPAAGWAEALGKWVEENVDIDRIIELADSPEPPLFIAARPEKRAVVAVAMDEAFCFYYHHNLWELEQAGAEIKFFSPIRDSGLPQGTQAVYIGGGYPEIHAEALADNSSMRAEIAHAASWGMPIYGECGGMMYLGRSLTDFEGRSWPMAGALELSTRMYPKLRALGYRQVSTTRPSLLGPAGVRARGHEFRYSQLNPDAQGLGLYSALNAWGEPVQAPGVSRARVVASYVHLHFGSNPALARALVGAASANRVR